MILIDYTETDYIYPLPPIFKTDGVLPPGLMSGPKGSDKEPDTKPGKKGPQRPPLLRAGGKGTRDKKPQKGSMDGGPRPGGVKGPKGGTKAFDPYPLPKKPEKGGFVLLGL